MIKIWTQTLNGRQVKSYYIKTEFMNVDSATERDAFSPVVSDN